MDQINIKSLLDKMKALISSNVGNILLVLISMFSFLHKKKKLVPMMSDKDMHQTNQFQSKQD